MTKSTAAKAAKKTGAAKRVAAKKVAAVAKMKPAAAKAEHAPKKTTRAAAKAPAKKAAKRTRSAGAKTKSAEADSSTLSNVAGQLFTWADKLTDLAAPVANMSLALAKAQFRVPTRQAAIKTAGLMLRQAREAVGMTVQEVGHAIDLKDAALLEQAETGTVALPFEVVLRLAGVLGRHDPVSFALKLTRSYNPELWAAMEALGVGKLWVQAGREREFANIYRRRDAARRLNDKEFAALLALVGSAFDMGLEFRNQLGAPRASGQP